MTRVAVLLAAFAVLAVSQDASTQPAQDFYKGRQISMLVSTAAGGGYGRLQMEIDPLDGAAIEALLAKAYSAPKDIIAAAALLVP